AFVAMARELDPAPVIELCGSFGCPIRRNLSDTTASQRACPRRSPAPGKPERRAGVAPVLAYGPVCP
ncbi:MAG TPA: hypothetical protein VNN80_28145, partial [Polyangiaceae bacterium]|nr:hypothetical protein [Polyangiaceae bacterium]